MKIYLNRIPETGLSGMENLEATSYGLDTEEVKVTSPLELSYRIFREEENLLIHFSVQCTIQLICGRCLCSYKSSLKKETELLHPIGREKVMDVTDDIRQEVLLEYPMKPLCQEACKGICSVCGQNLNEGDCRCTQKTSLHR